MMNPLKRERLRGIDTKSDKEEEKERTVWIPNEEPLHQSLGDVEQLVNISSSCDFLNKANKQRV